MEPDMLTSSLMPILAFIHQPLLRLHHSCISTLSVVVVVYDHFAFIS